MTTNKAKMPVSQQDKLWTQIDVLDDVRHLSTQLSSSNPSNIEKKQRWDELRQRQMHLVQLMKQREAIQDQPQNRGERTDVFEDMKNVFKGVEEELREVSELMRRK